MSSFDMGAECWSSITSTLLHLPPRVHLLWMIPWPDRDTMFSVNKQL